MLTAAQLSCAPLSIQVSPILKLIATDSQLDVLYTLCACKIYQLYHELPPNKGEKFRKLFVPLIMLIAEPMVSTATFRQRSVNFWYLKLRESNHVGVGWVK